MQLIRCIQVVPLLLAVSACFSPKRAAELNCSPEGGCPENLVCDVDNVCRERGNLLDAGSDGTIPPDAPTLECTPGGTQCEVSPDACFVNGVCDDESLTCVFERVPCEPSTDCKLVKCNSASGECDETIINEGGGCGMTTCEDFGECVYANDCAGTGTRSRTCTDFVCENGGCVGKPRTEEEDCERETEGIDCAGGTTCNAFSNCQFPPDVCAQVGTQSRDCTDRKCRSGTCTTEPRTENQECTRVTQLLSCGFQSCGPGQIEETCCFDGQCTLACGPCEPF